MPRSILPFISGESHAAFSLSDTFMPDCKFSPDAIADAHANIVAINNLFILI